jgi:hypothetical protein
MRDSDGNAAQYDLPDTEKTNIHSETDTSSGACGLKQTMSVPDLMPSPEPRPVQSCYEVDSFAQRHPCDDDINLGGVWGWRFKAGSAESGLRVYLGLGWFYDSDRYPVEANRYEQLVNRLRRLG